jgi:hypothetical protein
MTLKAKIILCSALAGSFVIANKMAFIVIESILQVLNWR